MNTAFLAMAGLGLVLAGCVVPAVYPFYTQNDLIAEPALTGSWVPAQNPRDNQNKETWIFEKTGERSLHASILSGNETNSYSAHLFKLQGQEFMDAVPLENNANIPAHYLIKVLQVQPTLHLANLNYKWMDEFLSHNPDALPHIVSLSNPDDTNSEVLVLTANTSQLQRFIVKHLGETNLFIVLDEMKRISN
jgi:hypothetical protein